MTTQVSLKELIEAGAHFGHQARRWNPKMRDYLYGEKEGVHIFDLTKTKTLLEEALEAITRTASEGKSILFVGTKKQAKDEVAKKANESGAYYVNERWLGGTLTNFDQIRKSLRRMNDIKTGLERGEFSKYTKKERLLLDRERERLERFLGGLNGMEAMPDLLIVIDIKREKTAIREAKAKGVEVVAIVDSNSDPSDVDYPIPMNDDASKALEYILGLMRDAILEGKKSKNTAKVSDKEEKEKKKNNKKEAKEEK